ncbi:MAG: universal stress protein [Actinomycetota bacterium]
MSEPRIVVGVDGSEPSGAALRWAVSEAELRGASVEAVLAWRYPSLTFVPGIVAPPVFAREDLEAGARAELDHAVDQALAGVGTPVGVARVVVEGAAAEVLLARSHGADLLVVGHRGRGGFAGLLLGSVAQQCAAHGVCPVVVVRHPAG